MPADQLRSGCSQGCARVSLVRSDSRGTELQTPYPGKFPSGLDLIKLVLEHGMTASGVEAIALGMPITAGYRRSVL